LELLAWIDGGRDFWRSVRAYCFLGCGRMCFSIVEMMVVCREGEGGINVKFSFKLYLLESWKKSEHNVGMSLRSQRGIESAVRQVKM
jgi:hypothetical protein